VARTELAVTAVPLTTPYRFDRHELAGSLADLGVFVPIAVALIVVNGLSATAVLLPAGLLYIGAGRIYRLPVPVQPLKAFGAIAIARGIGPDGIAAGALLMGVIFLVLGWLGLIDLASRAIPRPVIRGVQLSVGLLFIGVAWGLVSQPPAGFSDADRATVYLVGGAIAVAVAAVLLRRRQITLVLVALAGVAMLAGYDGTWQIGPAPVSVPRLDLDILVAAFVLLVVPQLPLTFANSCLATADAARVYFGERSARVRPGRLAVTLGSANLFASAISGMPVCHGAGGMTAHYAFGARTGGAPIALGAALVAVALVIGADLAGLLAGFPLPILAGLLAVSGLLHIGLLRDLEGAGAWALALMVGILGFATNLAVALILGLAVWWAAAGLARLRARRSAAYPEIGQPSGATTNRP
jgi:hypothetical protein